jgi:hypothetical protein
LYALISWCGVENQTTRLDREKERPIYTPTIGQLSMKDSKGDIISVAIIKELPVEAVVAIVYGDDIVFGLAIIWMIFRIHYEYGTFSWL